MRKVIKFGKFCTPGAAPHIVETGTLVQLALHDQILVKASSVLYGHLEGVGLSSLKPNTIVRLTDHFTGETTLVNTSYVLTAKVVRFVTIWSDLTQNENCGKGGKISREDTYIFGLFEEFELQDKYDGNFDHEGRTLIHTAFDYRGAE